MGGATHAWFADGVAIFHGNSRCCCGRTPQRRCLAGRARGAQRAAASHLPSDAGGQRNLSHRVRDAAAGRAGRRGRQIRVSVPARCPGRIRRQGRNPDGRSRRTTCRRASSRQPADPYTLPHVGPGEKPGTFTGRYRFSDSGQYAVAASAKVGIRDDHGRIPGQRLGRARSSGRRSCWMPSCVLIFGALIFSAWRARGAAAGPGGSALPREAALVGAAVAVLVGAHLWLGPRVGRMFLPERHFSGRCMGSGRCRRPRCRWLRRRRCAGRRSAGSARSHASSRHAAPHPSAEAKPPGGDLPPGDPDDPHEIVSTVVPVPGQLVDVMVPASARVLFGSVTPHVGRTVRRGQTLATLEYNYVLHDAVHMVNQRWLYLVPMLAAKRASLRGRPDRRQDALSGAKRRSLRSSRRCR